jgi:hypothetical protein
MAKPVDIQN